MEENKIDQISDDTERQYPLASPRDHQLWVNLSSLGEGNIFATLPMIVKKFLLDGTGDMDEEFYDLILPSDNEWQTKIYYKLVEKQRMMENKSPEIMIDNEDSKESKLHEWNILPKNKSSACVPEITVQERKTAKSNIAPITWTVRDISKAGCLLSKPPLPVTFDDEQEMRRVYTLIYDVFRYKNVLMQALNDIAFFQIFPKLEITIPHVWLLLYDLYHRSFKKRETAVAPLASKLFDSAGLSFAENALWTQRVKLAAAISRLRIKNNALSLNDLLPGHLKDEKVTIHGKNNPVTCWVNCTKVNDIQQLTSEIEKVFNLKMVHDTDQLGKDTYKWDKHCPQIMGFHSSMRGQLARSKFIRNYLLIVQDKSFCRGAATFGKILYDLELTGSVIQTHVNSPRTTAYLATLLTHNEKIKKLMAFSAGKRKSEYECYFTELGVKNIIIFADRLIDLPPDASYMEEVVAVFATPPNSYSAVTDPIDLVCSRGGDLSMLEILTESEETKEAKERVISILEEQRRTLRFAMSRPQIQFVLYETHSELEVENDEMVNKTLRDVNKLAKLQHANLQGRFLSEANGESPSIPMDLKEINNNDKPHPEGAEEPSLIKKNSIDSISKLPVDVKEKILENLEIPDTDIFINSELPNLCPSENSCINYKKEGCFLALIQRKEIVRLDDKYMIQMAENRGLFGSNTSANTAKSKSSRASKKKQQKQEKKPKLRRKLNDAEIDRIAAPTYTYLSHTQHNLHMCRRCQLEQEQFQYQSSKYKKWWCEATRHLIDLKKFLVKQKLIPSDKLKQISKKGIINSLSARPVINVDDIVAKHNVNSRFPVYPKLKLSRDTKFVKLKVPITITNMEFPEYCIFCTK
ncbi:uncharacterized protein LOC143191222 isoform X1 [Rhynchophorus ferrugineus]|uniref:uncharacterized protein LOC143191222 isoform X1 n=1 Tax=Rhynchophorus ferrugineus TaxID=354439 RepID=UPI003FCEE11E